MDPQTNLDLDPDGVPCDGIDGTTGEPLHPALPAATIAALARHLPPDPRQAAEAAAWRQAVTAPHLGTTEDPRDLAAAGWGVVFPQGGDPAVREALAPLLEHRRQTAGDRFRLFAGDDGYRPGETKQAFLTRHGVGPGPAQPERVPYYLLLAGGPEEIPWAFQHQLDLQYAVGRIAFDRPAEHATYARGVVTAETAGTGRPRRAVFFGTQNPGDEATAKMSEHLVRPLAGFFAAERPDWSVDTLLAEGATKERLAEVLRDEAPALLFTACHGMGFPAGDARQLAHQGALLCQDWPGRAAWQKAIPTDHYLAADDVGDGARLGGLIAFVYACHGIGTPAFDAYPERTGERRALSPRPFLAQLPKRLLGHPGGGALAVIGHVERTWGYSFLWKGAGEQPQVFECFFEQLLDGYPVGAALESFALRYAELSEMLGSLLEEIDFGAAVDKDELTRLWTAHNDARGYALLGDPAVRLTAA